MKEIKWEIWGHEYEPFATTTREKSTKTHKTLSKININAWVNGFWWAHHVWTPMSWQPDACLISKYFFFFSIFRHSNWINRKPSCSCSSHSAQATHSKCVYVCLYIVERWLFGLFRSSRYCNSLGRESCECVYCLVVGMCFCTCIDDSWYSVHTDTFACPNWCTLDACTHILSVIANHR